MIHVKQLSVAAAIAACAVFTQYAYACSPPPLHILKSSVGLDAKLPLQGPRIGLATPGSCPGYLYPDVHASTTDAGILKYFGPDPAVPPLVLSPAWEATKVYVAGNAVSYTGKNYKARYWTQGETPGATSAVWEEQPDAYGNPGGWSSGAAYQTGSKVTYGGNIYSAKWWSQGEVPGTGASWTLVGPAAATGGKRPANFTYTFSGNSTPPTLTTESFSLADYPLADSWEVHVGGVLFQKSTAISTIVTPCAVGSACVPRYTQSATIPLTFDAPEDTFVIWLCAKTACRPTWKITTRWNGVEVPSVAP